MADSQHPPRQPDHSWNPFFRDIIVFVLIVLLFRSLAFEPFHIPSGSMKSGLLVGDYLFVSKFSYGFSRFSFPFGMLMPWHGRVLEIEHPQRGDVVVFRPPGAPAVDFIKRVIGLPGDRLQMKEGRLFINGQELAEEPLPPFADDEDSTHVRSIPQFNETLPGGKVITILKERSDDYANNTPEFTVPPGHYFMMGDNRDESRDSRYIDDVVGYVPEENIVGKAQIVLFSLHIDEGGPCGGSWPNRAPPGGWDKLLFYAVQVVHCGGLRADRFLHWIH